MFAIPSDTHGQNSSADLFAHTSITDPNFRTSVQAARRVLGPRRFHPCLL